MRLEKFPFFLFLTGTSLFHMVFASEMINVECIYTKNPTSNATIDDPIDLAFNSDERKRPWYRLWNETPVVRFYIDIENKEATNSFGVDFKIDDLGLGDEIKLAWINEMPDQVGYEYTLNRLNGDFSGTRYAYDYSYLPDFKRGEIIEHYNGTCEELHVKF